MKVAFLISSAGDTDLALRTIQALEQLGEHEAVIISLTKTAKERTQTFQSSLVKTKITLPEILNPESDAFPTDLTTKDELENIRLFLGNHNIDLAYIGVPSVNSEIPFKLAESFDIPVLMAYEFMFKPENHCLWNHVPSLSKKPNIKWALPLFTATEDFPVPSEKRYITGHLSIDNAYSGAPASSKKIPEIKELLQIAPEKKFTFISSTTQPVEIDTDFLNCLLTELKEHPDMQVRLGLHPGIQDFDAYLKEIVTIYKKHPEIADQFKIILPDNLVERIKSPALTINDPQLQNLFLRVNITGSEAAFAADRITQAVPGALLNQAVLEGKPAYSHLGKPYLPKQFFSQSISSFFTSEPQPPRLKEDLNLDNKTAPENYAEIIVHKF